MAITTAIIKAVNGCNMKCKYCYVNQYGFGSEKIQLMKDDVLELLFSRVAEHVHANELSSFAFYWHGGEPLLQPMDFYEKVEEFSESYLSDIQVVHNLQTNGVRLTPDYARFLKRLGFDVSVSLDGPPAINDAFRTDHAGGPTSHYILKGINSLKSEEYPIKLLCVITPASIGHGAEIYRYFRNIGAEWMDFLLPHINSLHFTILPQDMPTQEQLAEFYIDVYREWINEDNPDICVRILRDYVKMLLGSTPELCKFRKGCSHIITVFPDGKIHTCDDLLSTFPEELGCLQKDSFDSILGHENINRVSENSQIMFGDQCLKCDYFDVCRAGCPNFRATEDKKFTGRYYYCKTSKIVIDYIRDDLLQMLSQKAGNKSEPETISPKGYCV